MKQRSKRPILPTSTVPEFAIHVDGLTHLYPPARGPGPRQRPAIGNAPALKDVGFHVQVGEIFGVLGPNGCGKTTLFRILATMLKPTSGHAQVFGHNMRSEPSAVRRQLGVVFQMPSLDAKLTVRENLRHHGHLYGLTGARLSQQIDDCLEKLGLNDRSDDLVEYLSGGLRRRVELAKSLLSGPRVLLLDEPSTGLDPAARLELWENFERLQADSRVTIFLTTHLMDEADRCDRLAIISGGQLIAVDTPGKLKDRIGGDVITIELEISSDPNAQPESIRHLIDQRFGPWPQGAAPTLVNGHIHLEKPNGAAFVTTLATALPDAIRSITVGRPTLEDVFLHLTGDRLLEE